MPLDTQLSLALSLEVAKVFPIREALSNGVGQLSKLVRALRRNGSDFLIEEDLADIFGRGKIEPSLEKDFRDIVRAGSVQSLHADSPIALDAGPGATVRRALKDRFYMASVIQLSFLVWMHEETTLAAALVENMLERYESKVQGATPDPDYDGILKTLQACSSQTSHYRWDKLVAHVETRFQRSTHWFCRDRSPLRSLSPNLLLGAMDYLYMVQSLPEDRFIVIENQFGLVPMVIWAHYILGLNVLVENSPDGDVAFGSIVNPHVIIKWSSTLLSASAFTAVGDKQQASPPTIVLLDADMHVVLKTEPRYNESIEIEGQDCHRLQEYGTIFLRRLYNKKTLIADDDPVIADTANFAVSFAILLSRVMRRHPLSDEQLSVGSQKGDVPTQCFLGTEAWRMFNSAQILFWGIKLDRRQISENCDRLSGKSIEDMAIPTSIRNYLENWGDVSISMGRQRFFDDIRQLASWILSFAQVVNIDSCTELPLRIAPGWLICTGVMNWDGLEPIDIGSDIWFNLIMKMMKKDTMGGSSIIESEGLFLTCHQGWSLFYSIVGDYDPGEINCELLCIKQGVPTNTRTGERKYRIADAPSVLKDVMTPRVLDNGDSYVPRCSTKVYNRTEHYSTRRDEFWLSIRFDIEELDFQNRTRVQRTGQDQKYSLYASYSQFHQALWGVVKTIQCAHGNEDCKPLPLDLGTRTVTGLTWANGNGNTGEARICICLVKGDARARWLVVNGIIANDEPGSLQRQLLLRCEGCCADCAVKSASAMKGSWLVVL